MNIRSLAALLAVCLVAASCTSGTSGIFASIEREQKVVSLGGIAATATVTSMAELTRGSHQYFLTGGQSMFTRLINTVTWNKMLVAGSSQVSAVGSVGAIGNETIFAVASNVLYSSTDGSTWTAVPLLQGDIPADLLPVRNADGVSNDQLIVVTYNTAVTGQPSYQDVYLIDATGTVNANPVNLLASVNNLISPDSLNGLSANPISAVYTGALGVTGSPYYLASQNYLWRINSTFNAATTITVTGVSYGYQGLLYLSRNSTLYLSTMSNAGSGGGLYLINSPSANTLAFTALVTNQKVTVNPVWFTQFLYNTVNNSLWIATGSSSSNQGNGYAEYTLSTAGFSTTPSTNTDNYNSTVLPTSAVGVLWPDHESANWSNPNYFLGTLSQGLWLWSGTGSATPTWTQQ